MSERFNRVSNAVLAFALAGCQVGEKRGVVFPTETVPPPPAFPVTEFSPAASTATAELTEPASTETPPLPQPPSVDELSDLSLKSPESLDWGRELGSDEQVYINISQAAYAGLAAQYPEIGFDVHVNVSTAGYQVWAVGTNGRVYGEREVLLGPDGKVLRDESGNILYGNLRELPVLSLLNPPQIAALGLSGYQDIQWEAFPPVAVPEGIDASEIDFVYVTEDEIARFVYRAREVVYAAYDATGEGWVYAQKSGIAAGGIIAGAPDIFATPTPESQPTQMENLVVGKDLLWNGEPAPLGVLSEDLHFQENQTQVVVSGVITEVHQEEVVIAGKNYNVWMASVYFGKDEQGTNITGKFLLGFDDNTISRVAMRGRTIGLEPNPVGNYSHSFYVDSLENVIGDLELNDKQYAFDLFTEIDLGGTPLNTPWLLFLSGLSDSISYNEQIVGIMRDNNIELSPNSFGWIHQIWFTPDHPVESP